MGREVAGWMDEKVDGWKEVWRRMDGRWKDEWEIGDGQEDDGRVDG